MVTAKTAQKIITALKQTVAVPTLIKTKNNPFETLIITILSQNTSDKNSEVAFTKLKQQFPITPKALTEANTTQIENCIKTAGLSKNKTQTIQTTSKIIHETYNDTLTPILNMPLEKARQTLTQISGIGPKTADVLLLFSAQKPTIPIDTHIKRVSQRIGLTPKTNNYEIIRQNLQNLFQQKDYLTTHQLLIGLGRQYCKAQKPLCKTCPINKYCKNRETQK
jgi:endonuclease-3